MLRTAEIKLIIDLDGNDLPTRIEWQASEGQENGPVLCQSMMLSVWDSENKTTAAIDLWTKDMPVDEMKVFFHQTLVAMSDTFNRATQDEKMTATMKDFCDYFADKLELKK